MVPQFTNGKEQLSRFAFGKNWSEFLNLIDDKRIAMAEQSLRNMLKVDDLKGKRFLDIGSGSGLFSLAARRLGAEVFSFDYDPQSVACSKELKRCFFANDPNWIVEKGSVLDLEFLKSLGKWDVVYSWGVLHHTGDMLQAFENVSRSVSDGGQLFIAIYNNQGRASRFWWQVKKTYNLSPHGLKRLILWITLCLLWGPAMLRDLIVGRPFQSWKNYSNKNMRGMSPWHDLVDWVGGFPFEVATPEQIFYIFRDKGFHLEELKTCSGGHGCNEFVFRKIKNQRTV